jgi:hypothetical protein
LFVQHSLPGPAHTLPQHELPLPHGNLRMPWLFSQHSPSLATHTSPQHSKSLPHQNSKPLLLTHTVFSDGQRGDGVGLGDGLGE